MKIKVLIFGAAGMLGNALFYQLSKKKSLEVTGTVWNKAESQNLPISLQDKVIANIDIEKTQSLIEAIGWAKPDVVLNCVGLIKQVMTEADTAKAIAINALFPHRLAALCKAADARLIHFSTDCVFSGAEGNYREQDPTDAADVYGKSKFLGELLYDHTVTIRTSIIGHGLESHLALVDWFLDQKGEVKGFNKVIYSGLTTVEIARVITDFIIPNRRLKGLYHVSAKPISKYALLEIIKDTYQKKIKIIPTDEPVYDQSLDSTRFRKFTGYIPPSWDSMIKKLYQYYETNSNFIRY